MLSHEKQRGGGIPKCYHSVGWLRFHKSLQVECLEIQPHINIWLSAYLIQLLLPSCFWFPRYRLMWSKVPTDEALWKQNAFPPPAFLRILQSNFGLNDQGIEYSISPWPNCGTEWKGWMGTSSLSLVNIQILPRRRDVRYHLANGWGWGLTGNTKRPATEWHYFQLVCVIFLP